MSQKELYQQVILEHNRTPRNFGVIEKATHELEGHNPLCGDRLVLTFEFSSGVVRQIAFTGSGCAISKASASLMTDLVKELDEIKIRELFQLFRDLVMGKELHPEDLSKLGKLKVFSGISEYPSRVKCAILAWHTLVCALEGKKKAQQTE